MSGEQYQRAVQAGRVGVWHWNLRTNALFLCNNLKFMLDLGAEGAETDLQRLKERLHPDDLEQARRDCEACLSGREEQLESEYRIRQPDGTFRWFLCQGTVERDAERRTTHICGTTVDITARKEAEAGQRRLLDTVEAAADAVATADAEGQVMYFNPAGRELIGMPPDAEVAGTYIPDYHPAWAGRLVMEEGLPTAAQEGVWRDETAMLGPDGREIPVWQAIVAHHSTDGQIEFYSTIMRDLTERKQAEEALRHAHDELEKRVEQRTAQLAENAERLEQAQRVANLGFWDWNVTTGDLFWSDEVYRIFGLDPNAAPSMTYARFLEFVRPEDRPAIARAVERALNEPGAPYSFEHGVVRPDGTVRMVHEQARVTFENGQPVRMLGTVQDITNRRRTERMLHAILEGTSAATGQRFFELLVGHLADALSVRCALIGEFADPEADRLRTLAVHIDGSLSENLECDVAESPCGQLNRSGWWHHPQRVREEFPDNRVLKQLRAESCLGTLLKDAAGEPIGVLAVIDDRPMPDVSMSRPVMATFAARAAAELERLRAEHRLRDHQMQIAQVSRWSMAGSLASGLSHELNQPLCAIANYTGAAVRHLQRDTWEPGELIEDLRRANAQAERAGQVIRKLREFMMADRQPQAVPLDLRDVIGTAAELLSARLRRFGVEMVVSVAEDLPPVAGDQVQLEQVIINLAYNAIEAMAEADSERRRLTIRAYAEDDRHVIVCVEDTGPGLTEQQRASLFDSFYTTKDSGLGMGLAICRSIVEAYGGGIWVAAQPDTGANFCFKLPREEEPER